MKRHLHSAFLSLIFLLTLMGIGTQQTLAQSFAITSSPGPHGTITPAGVNYVSAGSGPVYSINADPGYHLVEVFVDGISQGTTDPYMFNGVFADHTISATFAPNSYTITASAGPHGQITGDGTNSYDGGSDINFFMTPDPGYKVSQVLFDGLPAGSNELFVINTLTDNHTISVTFEPSSYTITASKGPHGSISNEGTISYDAGTDVSIALQPDEGYHVATFTVDGTTYQGSTFQFTFPAINADHTFSVTFEADFFTVTVTAGPHGYVSGLGANQYANGSDVTLALSPDPGYQVATYTVDGVVITGSTPLFLIQAIKADHTFSATFTPIIYTITATAGAHGSISNAGAHNVNGGSDQTYTITPALGYKVSQVTVDGVSQGALTQFTFHLLTDNHTISATFIPDVSFTIKATAGANGTITPSGNTSVGYGNNATYTITAAAGYHVATLKVDGTSLNPATSYTFNNVTANHTISATYALTSFNITASASAGGTISPTGTVTVSPGGTKTYTIKPTAGYTVSDVTLDGVSIGTVKSYVFTNVQANHLIIATFTPVTYVITSSAGANGSISPSGPVSLAYGGSQTYTFTPATGYSITKLTVDGKSVTIAPSYTFTNVTAAHTITVTFICPKPTAPVISGPATVIKQQDNLVYTVTNATAGNSFTWTVPGAASITSGQGTSSITVKWGKTAGSVTCIASNTCSSSAKTSYAVALGSGTRSASEQAIEPTPAIEETPTVTLQINPNPAQDKAKIIFNLTEAAKCKISVIDLTGRLLKTIETDGVKGYNEATIDVSRFAGGTYYVSLVHGKGIKTVMLVKAH